MTEKVGRFHAQLTVIYFCKVYDGHESLSPGVANPANWRINETRIWGNTHRRDQCEKNNVRSQSIYYAVIHSPISVGRQGHTKTSHSMGFISTLALICMTSDRGSGRPPYEHQGIGIVQLEKSEGQGEDRHQGA